MLSNTLRYGIFADFFGYDVFSVAAYCHTPQIIVNTKSVHMNFCVTEGIGIQQLSGYYSDDIVNF